MNFSIEMEMNLQNVEKIGENDYGYSFAIGQISGKWYGFAVGALEGGERMIFILPGCDEIELDNLLRPKNPNIKEEIIRRVGAIAQSREHGYGGIARWFVEENLRGKPDDFRCEECGSVGCSSESHTDEIYFDEY